MEHDPWIGKDYQDKVGIGGQCIAVIGHSHYGNKPDFPGYTTGAISSCVHGGNEDFDGSMATFDAVPGYFGFNDARDFWPKVIFLNFLPTLVGTSEEKFGYGSDEQIKAGVHRLLRIFQNYKPTKAFVFSSKAWDCCPKTLEGTEQRLSDRLGHDFLGFRGGHYGTLEAPTMTFGLRHPMGASKDRMQRVVKTLMDTPLETWRDYPVFRGGAMS